MRERKTCGKADLGFSRAARENSPTASSRWPRCQYSTPLSSESSRDPRPKTNHAPAPSTAIPAMISTGNHQGCDRGGGTGSGVPSGDMRNPRVDIASPGGGVCRSSDAGDVMREASSLRNPSRAALMSLSVG